MSTHAGNHYAEKWTLHLTIDRLLLIQRLADQGEAMYLGDALVKAGVYINIWRYWRYKWGTNGDVIDLMGYIMQLFEARIVQAAANKEMHAGTAMSILKHQHGWNSSKPPKEEPWEEEKPAQKPQETPEAISVDQIATETKEIERIRLKVQAFNDANPDWPLTYNKLLTDIRPTVAHIEFRGGFYQEL